MHVITCDGWSLSPKASRRRRGRSGRDPTLFPFVGNSISVEARGKRVHCRAGAGWWGINERTRRGRTETNEARRATGPLPSSFGSLQSSANRGRCRVVVGLLRSFVHVKERTREREREREKHSSAVGVCTRVHCESVTKEGHRGGDTPAGQTPRLVSDGFFLVRRRVGGPERSKRRYISVCANGAHAPRTEAFQTSGILCPLHRAAVRTCRFILRTPLARSSPRFPRKTLLNPVAARRRARALVN